MGRPDRELPEYSYAARRQRAEIDPAMRRIALAAAAVSVLVIGVALLWDGVRPGMGYGPPPEIMAPSTPLRVAPVDPGGLTVPGAEVPIMSGQAAAGAPELTPDGPSPDISQFQQAAGIVVAPAPAPVLAAPAPAAMPGGGVVEVQLAAAVDAAGVKAVWSQLNVKIPELLKGVTPQFVPAVVDGQSIWRLRVGGFADAAAAKAFCDAVNAKGAACTVAAF